MKTKEQLLLPRYRVIADYPFSPHKIGDILERDTLPVVNIAGYNELGLIKYTQYSLPIKVAGNYPHLFAPVHWTENREKGEFPEYVLFDKTCVPAKVLSVRCDEQGFVIEVETDAEPGEYYRADIWDFPATQEEYEAYKQSKQKS